MKVASERSKAGNRIWRVSYYVAGERRRKTFGTEAEANRWARNNRLLSETEGRQFSSQWLSIKDHEKRDIVAALDLIRKHREIEPNALLVDATRAYVEQRSDIKRSLSFSEAVERFLAGKLHSKRKGTICPNWHKTLETCLHSVARDLPQKTLAEFTASEIETYLEERMDDDDWSPRSFNNYVAYLNSVWTWAEDEGLVRENPILKIEKFGKRYLTKEVIVPSLALIRTIFALSAKPQFKHLRAALDLGFGLAMRNSEISRLEWSNIQSDLIQVPNNVAKGGRGRNIQRTDLLNGVFESLNKAKRSNSNGPIILKGWRRSLTPLFEAAGLGKPRNIMRRSGASYFFHAAGSEAATRQMMGHTQNSGIFTSSYQALSFSSGQERIAISKADGLAYYQIWV